MITNQPKNRAEPEVQLANKRELEKRMVRNWNQVFDAIEGKRV